MNDKQTHDELFKSISATEVPKIIYWASLGNLEQVKSALLENPDINIKDSDGFTALDIALENNHIEVINYLVERGAIKK